MRFCSFLIPCFLLGAAVLAVPRGYNQPKIRAQATSGIAGAFLNMNTDELQSVQGSFTVPEASGVPGSGANIWIGLDGAACNGFGLSAGVTFSINNGLTHYMAFYKWGQNEIHYITDLPIVPGDTIDVFVNGTQPGVSAELVVGITNRNKSPTRLEAYGGPKALCMQSAQWMVEALETGANTYLEPLANFTQVVFNNPVAYGLDGSPFTLANRAFTYNIEQNGQFLTFTTIYNNSVVINYL